MKNEGRRQSRNYEREILDDYIERPESLFEETIAKLSEFPGYGELNAGELMIEAARNSDNVTETLMQASTLLKNSIISEQAGDETKINPNIARSKLLQAQLPVFRLIFEKDELPDLDLATKTYGLILKIGSQLAGNFKTLKNESEKYQSRATLAYIAVHALLYRESIHNDWTEFWVPITPTVTERLKVRKDFGRSGMPNLLIVSDTLKYGIYDNNPDRIRVDTKILVKATNYHEKTTFIDPRSGVRRVYAHPDLDIKGEKNFENGPDIIEDSLIELNGTFHERKQLAINRLNFRSTQLKAVLEK